MKNDREPSRIELDGGLRCRADDDPAVIDRSATTEQPATPPPPLLNPIPR